MKKIFLAVFILACIGLQAQSVQTIGPGQSRLVTNLAIAGIGGADTTIKFRMPNGCISYAIEILQTDTIETVATSVWFYGSNDGGSKIQVGDTVILAKDAVTQVDYITGTTFPYTFGHLRIPKYTVSDGDLTIIINYAK